jgi:triacylglycerol lipase
VTPHDFALIAQEAYTATPDIGVASSASRAIVRQTAAGLVIAFPGTDNVASWVADLDALTVHVPGAGDIHAGFWKAWKAIEEPVLAAIGDQPVTLVGHSLGGALAVLAAAALTLVSKPPAAVFAFEPPRVSPDSGVDELLVGVPVFLSKNGNDLVPNVPLGWHLSKLTQLDPAALPVPNIIDHEIAHVIAHLEPA